MADSAFPDWGAMWREYNRRQERRLAEILAKGKEGDMKQPTVNWLPELARTSENEDMALKTFSKQIPRNEVPIEFYSPAVGVWGWFTRSCTLLFVEPQT